jgi:sulfur carrier protein
MRVVINGNERDFPTLSPSASIADLLGALELKGDRVALEHNGNIIRREAWSSTPVHADDKFEIVHFVGGGV